MRNNYFTTSINRSLLIFATIFLFVIQASAQLHIGPGSTPDPNSILDLHSSDKFLKLPISSTVPTSTSLDTVGAMIYYNGNIYLRTPSGIKVFTPWKLDAADIVSSSSGNPVGIGLLPISNSNRLMVADASSSGVSITAGATASIAVGINTGQHLLMDSDEMMAKNNLTSAGILNFQKEEGVVAVRLLTTSTNSTVLQANGSIDATNKGKIREHGYDLLPTGSIAMWYSTTIPAGWAICDGGSYPSVLDPAIFISTPNLIGKFLVGAGGNNPIVAGGSYPLADLGGTNTSNHTHPIDPPNVVTGASTSHTHTGTTDASDTHTVCAGACPVDFASGAHTHTYTTDSEASHTHNMDIPNLPTSGGPSVNENRPPYFALIYIMKL